MPGKLQIAPFCAPQRMDAEIPDAAHSGGYRTSVLSHLSQHVTVIVVTGQSAMPRPRSVGDRRPRLSQGGRSNRSAHQALPNRAHGALLLPHRTTRPLTAGETHPMTELPEPGVFARAVLPQARPAAADGDLQSGKSLAGLVDGADPGDRAGIVAVDADPAPAGTPIRGLRARNRYLTSDQRVALHRLRRLRPPMGARAAAILDVIACDPRALTECHRDLDPEVVIALQQRGIIRRLPRLLAPDAPVRSRAASIPFRALTFSWRRPLTSRVVSSDILVSFHTRMRLS